jgi:hypothetical protein
VLVEGHGDHPELGGEGAHGERVEACGVGAVERAGEHDVAGEARAWGWALRQRILLGSLDGY